jgi:hypothetical protein
MSPGASARARTLRDLDVDLGAVGELLAALRHHRDRTGVAAAPAS